MAQTDPLREAVADIKSVSDELKAVKKRAEQYGQATSRLEEMSAALEKLVKTFGGIQSNFQDLLKKANSVSAEIEKAHETVNEAFEAVPGIIQKIDSTDVARVINKVDAISTSLTEQLKIATDSLLGLGQEIHKNRILLEAIQRDQEKTSGLLESVPVKLDELEKTGGLQEKQISQLKDEVEKLKGLAEKSCAAAEGSKLASDNAGKASLLFGNRSTQSMEDLSKKLDSLLQMLEAQDKKIDEMKAKKGIYF